MWMPPSRGPKARELHGILFFNRCASGLAAGKYTYEETSDRSRHMSSRIMGKQQEEERVSRGVPQIIVGNPTLNMGNAEQFKSISTELPKTKHGTNTRHQGELLLLLLPLPPPMQNHLDYPIFSLPQVALPRPFRHVPPLAQFH